MLTIRSAVPGDVSLIHRLMIAAFREYKKSDAPSSALEETIESIAQAFTEGEQAFIAYLDGCPIGMVRFRLRMNDLYFYRLAVEPACRGRGIGKKLVLALENPDFLQNKSMILCRVRKNAARNILLYQSIGYRTFAEETVHKSSGIDVPVVFMRKYIEIANN